MVVEYRPTMTLCSIPVWGVFCDWRLPTSDSIEFMRRVSFDDVILGIGNKTWGSKTGRWEPVYSRRRVVECANTLVDFGFRVHLMSWAIRSAIWVKQAIPWFADTAIEAGAYSVLLDAEKDWHEGKESAAKVASVVKNIMDGYPDLRLGVTGLSKLHSTVFPLAVMVDYTVPQAYPIWKPGAKRHWSHSKSTFPGVLQSVSYKSWAAAGSPENIVMGLSNYWGARPVQVGCPKITQEQTLTWSCAEIECLGVTAVWLWSLKWFLRRTETAEAMRRLFGVYGLYE